MIVENFKYVLDNYYNAYDETFADHPVVDFVRNELGEPFKELIDTDKYLILGETGQGRWAIIPSLITLNRRIMQSPLDGYYIVYLFKANAMGVYLSLNFGAT